MADYAQQDRMYPRPPPPNNGGMPPRDFSGDFDYVFGNRPQNSRSQSMGVPAQPLDGRAHTMSAQTFANMSRPLPPRQQYQGTNGYQIPNGSHAVPAALQPQPQHRPQPAVDRQMMSHPQRMESRPSYPPQQFQKPTPNRGPGPGMGMGPGPGPSAGPGPGPGYRPGPPPAMAADPFRSQSLAMGAGPPPFRTGGPYNGGPPGTAFRAQSYQNNLARTTAQGRPIPERMDERSMSMTSLSHQQYTTTQSGRAIPNRRRESRENTQQADPRASTETWNSGSTAALPNGGPLAEGRSMSMASTITPPSDRSYSMTSRPSMTKVPLQQQQAVVRRRAPLVYPALLSKVASVFLERIALGDKEKDGLVYKSAFTGADAVDVIAFIMQTTDRNLALLLGRSMDAQKFFHDVTYDHRLRDSQAEVYQFREALLEDENEVNGVFTLTTECYSPTCTPDRLCYSIACPKRVDQQKRLNMRPQQGLQRQDSRASLHEEQSDEQKLWINTVSKEVADSIDDKEKKRQEVISELCYTERDFVKDLEYMQDFWLKPLRSLNPAKPSPIPEHRREKFLRTVFANCSEVYAVNSRLAEALTRRQQQNPVVRNVGDIILEHAQRFKPFITYGSNQLFGKYEYEREKSNNPAFKRFADETERLKESRKLELNGYLTKPTTRLARYPLLLEGVLKSTAEDSPDREDIPKAIAMIRSWLSEVNVASGKAENHFTLMQLSQQLVFRPGEFVDLKLTEENRKLLFKGHLKKNPTDNMAEIQTFLFDHAILFVRAKTTNKREELKVYKKPIPLWLLVINQADEVIPRLGLAKRPSSSLIPARAHPQSSLPKADSAKQQGNPITFRHLGRGGFDITLYATSPIQREKWIKLINDQQEIMREHRNIFKKTVINEGFFGPGLKINCCVSIDGGRKLVAGTDTGVFVMSRRPGDAGIKPRRALDCKNVTQIDVLEQHQILLVLSEKTLFSYSAEVLEPDESALGPSRRGRKISGANFFKVGVFTGQHLVCCVKTSAMSGTIKVFQPMDSMTSSKKKSGLSRMLAGGQDVLRPYKEFYVPTETYSVHFLKSSLCVGCARGFEIVTLDTLVTQPLLDQADTSLDFVAMKENLRPIHLERIARDFLLCYSDFSFFVNKHGWRAFPEWKINWEGHPQAFAIFQPYILAFEPNFIEMRDMNTGGLVFILTAKHMRMLHSSTREILYAYEDEFGEDVIASLDFWAHDRA